MVTVVVPTKNSGATLEPCLRFIREQSYKNLELIVVDNFSTDNTPAIAKKYADVFYSQGPERSTQRNFGVNKAKGTYVAVLDSDMNLDKTVVQECVDIMQNNEDVRGVVIPEESFGEGFWARCKQLERSFYVGVPYMEAARFFKKSDFLKLGGYNVTMVSGEDWDLSQRIEKLGKLGRTNAYIRHNEGRLSLRRTMQKKAYYAKLFSTYLDNSTDKTKAAQQTNLIKRYALFLRNPRKLFAHPTVGLGVLFMKTCEFAAGGYGIAASKLQRTKGK